VIERESPKSQALGELTPAAVGALKEAGLFWMWTPRHLGGADISLSGGIRVIEEITRADGSAGWCLMANAGAISIAASFLGDAARKAMFGGTELPIVAGMFGPAGKSSKVPGGYQAGGRFAFGSGTAHAAWIAAGMLVMEDGKPKMLPTGIPEVRVCFIPKGKFELQGGWDVIGLSGTGSYNYEIPEQFVADDFTMERTSSEADAVLAPSPDIVTLGTCSHAAVALGLMKRALQEIIQIARFKKRPNYSKPLAENDVFKQEFSMNEAAYQAARDYVLHVFDDIDATLRSGVRLSLAQRARMRQSCTWSHRVAEDVIRFAHRWGGAIAVRNPTNLGRATMDMAVVINHITVDPSTLTDAAPAIMNEWLSDMAIQQS
jgi:alkylation response protein AidB-like acyl-CoA dehydrogenase